MRLSPSHNPRRSISVARRDGRSAERMDNGWAATYPHHTPTGSPDLVWWARYLDRLEPLPFPVGAATYQVAP